MQLSQVVPVSSLVQLLQELVEENFVDVLVQGELANFSRPASGHSYFTLKDQKSQLRCAMFRPQLRALRFQPQNGMEVICRGRVSIYPQRGDLQLIVDGIEPVGVGDLQLAFLQLQEKLDKEGLFSAARKRPLPAYPQTIGIVTSATGAAIHDILNVLRRRSAGVKILLRSVRVQGLGAAEEIAEAIADLNADGRAEVLIVGRGGGSREDLWAFNEELVARAIAASKLPVISAVGHEVDISIADLVADLRAPTPSAAAELVVKNRQDLERHLDQLEQRLAQQVRNRLELMQLRLQALQRRLKGPDERIRLQQQELQRLVSRLRQALQLRLGEKSQRLAFLSGRLDALSPLKVLGRGYAIAKLQKTGEILRDSAQVQLGDLIGLRLEKGTVAAVVAKKNRN
ncbi:MAG TPA: exodeoxyribonuclease VII large subunit [Malonomonas sp.]